MWDDDSMEANTKVGLFFEDLTDFLNNCELASNTCDYANYSYDYDGYAVGQSWFIDDAATLSAAGAEWIQTEHYIFTCFQSNGGCTGISSRVLDSEYGHYLWTGYYRSYTFTDRFP